MAEHRRILKERSSTKNPLSYVLNKLLPEPKQVPHKFTFHTGTRLGKRTIYVKTRPPNTASLFRFKSNMGKRKRSTRRSYGGRPRKRFKPRRKIRRRRGGIKKHSKAPFGRTSSLRQFGLGLPWRLRVKLKDVQVKTLALSGLSIVNTDFVMTDVFSRQPFYYDQLSVLYKEYTLSGVGMKWRFFTQKHQAVPTKIATTGAPTGTDFIPQSPFSPWSAYVRIKENIGVDSCLTLNEIKAKPFTKLKQHINLNGGQRTFSTYINPKHYSYNTYNKQDYTAAVDANPTVNTACEIGVMDDGISDTVTTTVYVEVTRTFYLTFRQIANTGES